MDSLKNIFIDLENEIEMARMDTAGGNNLNIDDSLKSVQTLKQKINDCLSELRSRLNGQSVLYTDAGRNIFDREVKDIFNI